MLRTRILALLVVFLFALAGCESDSGDSSGGGSSATPDPDEGKTATATVAAADGGELKTESGNAGVSIPAGALADDTEIGITVAPAETGTASSVYDFTPDGQQFQKAVTISIAFDGTVGENQKAVLGTYDENAKKWKEVPNSALAGGVVSGDVNHFSKYAIIMVDGEVVLVSECADMLTDFEACGGDPTGDWDFDAVCFPPESLGANPFAESCPDAKVDIDVTWDATLSFKSDGTTEMIMRGQTYTSTYDIPLDCLQAPMTCDILAEQLETTCSAASGNCVCEASNENVNEGAETEYGAWEVDGSNLIITDEGDEEPNAGAPFCVKGSEMHVKIVEEPDPEDPEDTGMEYVVILKKK